MNKKTELKSYVDEDDYDEDYFTFDTQKQYIKETGKMPYKKGDNDLSKHFKAWLKEKFTNDEANDVMLYKKQTGISAYEEDNKTLTNEFNKWYWKRERNND